MNQAMAEFGNGLAEESLLDSDPGHPELEDPGVGDEEPGLEEGEAAIEDPVSEGHITHGMLILIACVPLGTTVTSSSIRMSFGGEMLLNLYPNVKLVLHIV